MTAAIFFDGQSAHDRAVDVMLGSDGLHFEGPQSPPRIWRFQDLQAIERYQPGHPLRIACSAAPARGWWFPTPPWPSP